MTNFILSYGSYGGQTLTANEIGIVSATAVISSSITTGIFGSGGNLDVRVFGEILTIENVAISLSGDNLHLHLGATAHVVTAAMDSGYYAGFEIYNTLSASVVNEGSVSGNRVGGYLHTNAGGAILMQNSGSITAERDAVMVQGDGRVQIINTGSLTGPQKGITNVFSLMSNAAVDITNTGTISGGIFAVETGGGADRLINQGTLFGAVSLGAGDDFFDGRGGRTDAVLNGGAGNDLFILGDSDEVVDGGVGAGDAVDFRGNLSVTVALDGSLANLGRAEGDFYSNIENIYGSAVGDRLIGDAAANTLLGRGGNDVMAGGGGADKLRGGFGVDTLTGGAGDDSFIFGSLGDAGDVITDFGAVAGNNDRFQISTSLGGLVAGVLPLSAFQSRADNLAQDLNDRFIFRTTDATLWFDRDGTGSIAAVMLADLQAGAVVTAADLIIF